MWKFFLVAIFAAQLGNGILFFGGRHGLQKWIRNHHLRCLPSKERLDKFKKFFSKKHSWITIMALSCITTLRPFSALIAGATGMNPWKFFPFHFLGIFLWGSAVSLSGYYVGLPLLHIIKKDGYLGIAIIVVFLAYWYFWSQFPWHYFRKKKS
jgi:membrane protein DedA with SNARE-associated domain